MATNTDVSLTIGADLARWNADMDGIKRSAQATFDSIERYSASATNSAKTLGMAIAGIGAGLSVSTMVSKFESVTASLGGLKDMAERTGSSVENLSGLSAVARIGGRDMGELESSINKLNRALHSSDDESKGAAKALADIGLDITKLKQMDPSQAFMDIAKAQEKFADGGGKASAMMDIFGKTGAALIPMMHDMAEQGALVVKTTTEQAAAAKNLENDLRRLSATKDALYKIVSVEIIPVYDAFVKMLIQANNETDGLRKSAKDLAADGSIRSWAENAAIAVAHVIDEFQLVKAIAIEIATPIERVGRNIMTVGALASIAMSGSLEEKKQAFAALKAENEKYFADLDSRLAKNRQPVTLYSDRLKAQLAAMRQAQPEEVKPSLNGRTSRTPGGDDKKQKASDPLGDWIRDYEAQIKPALNALDAFTKMQREAETSGADMTKAQRAFYELINSDDWKMMAEPWKELVREQFAAADAAEQTAKNEQELNRLLANTPTAKIEQMRSQMLLLADAFERGRISEEQFIEAAQGITGMSKELQQVGDEMDEYAKRAAQSVQQSLSNFLFDPFNNGVKGMGKQFAQMIQKMIADAGAAQIAKSLFGTMGQASGGQSGNWGWVGQAATWAASFFADGGIMTDKGPAPLRRYASGGVASSPQLAMFGEGSTPEAYVPLPDGRSIPVKMQSQAGMNIHQTIYAGQGTDPAQVRRSAAAGARAVLGAMNGAKRYG